MEHRNNLALEITKHIVIVSMAAIGLVIAGTQTAFKETHLLSDFMFSIWAFALAIILSVLSQMALVSFSQGDRKAFGLIKDEWIINSSFACFLAGIFSCLVVVQ